MGGRCQCCAELICCAARAASAHAAVGAVPAVCDDIRLPHCSTCFCLTINGALALGLGPKITVGMMSRRGGGPARLAAATTLNLAPRPWVSCDCGSTVTQNPRQLGSVTRARGRTKCLRSPPRLRVSGAPTAALFARRTACRVTDMPRPARVWLAAAAVAAAAALPSMYQTCCAP